MSSADPSLWDAEAPAFDEAPDHGLLEPTVRAAWRDLLLGVLPAAEIVGEACGRVEVRPLPDPRLWGREISDQRYLVVAHP